jgi:hypothetical protein
MAITWMIVPRTKSGVMTDLVIDPIMPPSVMRKDGKKKRERRNEMARIIVEIELEGISTEELIRQIAEDRDTGSTDRWLTKSGNIIVDDAYLPTADDDDSFFEFKLVGVVMP